MRGTGRMGEILTRVVGEGVGGASGAGVGGWNQDEEGNWYFTEDSQGLPWNGDGSTVTDIVDHTALAPEDDPSFAVTSEAGGALTQSAPWTPPARGAYAQPVQQRAANQGAIPLSGAPRPTAGYVNPNALFSYAGQLYRYAAQTNAAGQVTYVPQPASNFGLNSATLQKYAFPLALIMIGLAMRNNGRR